MALRIFSLGVKNLWWRVERWTRFLVFADCLINRVPSHVGPYGRFEWTFVLVAYWGCVSSQIVASVRIIWIKLEISGKIVRIGKIEWSGLLWFGFKKSTLVGLWFIIQDPWWVVIDPVVMSSTYSTRWTQILCRIIAYPRSERGCGWLNKKFAEKWDLFWVLSIWGYRPSTE